MDILWRNFRFTLIEFDSIDVDWLASSIWMQDLIILIRHVVCISCCPSERIQWPSLWKTRNAMLSVECPVPSVQTAFVGQHWSFMMSLSNKTNIICPGKYFRCCREFLKTHSSLSLSVILAGKKLGMSLHKFDDRSHWVLVSVRVVLELI